MADTGHGNVLAALRGITQDHARTGMPLNMSLSIPGMGEVICTEVFRAIPGKRLVCLGMVGEARVIVKLYYAPRRAYRHWKRSDKGCRAFLRKRIPAPEILFSGYLARYDLYAMVLEFLEGGVRIDQALAAIPEKGMGGELPGLLMAELARHHASGIIQNDLHLGNFMVRNHIVHSLDGDQVEERGKPHGRRSSLRNLASLLANINTSRDSDLDAWIQSYVRERHWSMAEADQEALKARIYRMRKRNLSAYLGKTLRSRDPFVAQSGAGLFTVFDKRHTGVRLPDILHSAGRTKKAEGALGRIGYQVRTFGDRQLLQLSSCGAGPLVFKSLFSAVRVWRNALMLNRIGLQTPQPVALVMQRKLPLIWKCSVLSMPVDGIGLRDFLISANVSQEVRDRVAAGLVDALVRMTGVGVSPGGLKPEHILVAGEALVFIDPAAFRRPFVAPRARMARAVKRFLSLCAKIPGIDGLTWSGSSFRQQSG